jgi:ABC-type antimicrobial peptide transport system permease subunit
MSQVVDGELANRRTQATLVGAFAVLALLLSSIGLYAVLSYDVSQRTPEIGVRMSLGATREQVVGRVVGRALLTAAAGIAFGLLAALALTQVLASLLFGVEPNDPVTFATVPALLLVVALLASYLPARRAVKVDPLTALRRD